MFGASLGLHDPLRIGLCPFRAQYLLEGCDFLQVQEGVGGVSVTIIHFVAQGVQVASWESNVVWGGVWGTVLGVGNGIA